MSDNLIPLSGVSTREISAAISLLEMIWDPKRAGEANDLLAKIIKEHADVTALHVEASKKAGASEQANKDLLAAAMQAYEDAEKKHTAAIDLHTEISEQLRSDLEAVEVRKRELDKREKELVELERAARAFEVEFNAKVNHQAAELTAREASVTKREQFAQENVERSAALRAEYEDKLGKLKAVMG